MVSSTFTQWQREMRDCRRCLEAGYPIREGAIFSGSASAQVMVVGQAPGTREGGTGLPFSGPAGKRLFSWLAYAGFEESKFRATQYITAITKCFPGKGNSRGDRVPTAVECRLCAPFLAREIELVNPKLIIPVGRVAIDRFLGREKLGVLIGAIYEKDGRLVLPLPHPSGANLWLNRPASKRLLKKALDHLCQIREEMGL
ncbi:uracil-DNA glycosylase family protein [Candidatus Bipolaricaulota bacterium]|nr:uracil-DNA glycosylase family protein [Candidatus Bipolaricaulota bacterium]